MGRARNRGRPLPSAEPVRAMVQALTHDGNGLARVDGKAVFIAGALPGETVLFRYTRRRSQYDEGAVLEVDEPSPDRVEPGCAHFGYCGGCSLQHLAGPAQVAHKQRWLLENLERIGKVEPVRMLPPLTAESWGYRRKARLAARFVVRKGRVLVGFRERDQPYVADLARCEVLHPRVGGLLTGLGELIGSLSIRERVPQIEVAVGDDTVALSMRVLNDPTETDLTRLETFARLHDLHLYLQPGGPDSTRLLWPAEEKLEYSLPEHDLKLAFKPYHFTQVNLDINRRMVDLTLGLMELSGQERVLDLFCGLGNFTLPLARHAAAVVGVEGDASLVQWAEANARRNGLTNVCFHVANLMEEQSGADWLRVGGFQRVLLDPPRSGALEMVPAVAALGAERIVYVSCHPATLARDAGVLVHEQGYRLTAAGIMDMFPHTAHVESIALFERA